MYRRARAADKRLLIARRGHGSTMLAFPEGGSRVLAAMRRSSPTRLGAEPASGPAAEVDVPRAGLLCRPTVDRPTDTGPQLDCRRMTAEPPAAVRPNHPALLLAMPLEVSHDEVRR
jgi:hypothetical protein